MKNISRLVLLAFFASTIAVGSYVIPDLGVTTRKLAASAVTTAKITDGAVTPAKKAALGQQLSSAVVFSTQSTSATNVTSLAVTITTTGRPVQVIAIGDGGANGCTVGMNIPSSVGTGIMTFYILRDGTEIAQYQYLRLTSTDVTTQQWAWPCTAIQTVDTGASAASHTYQIQMKVSDSAMLGKFFNAKLLAYEL